MRGHTSHLFFPYMYIYIYMDCGFHVDEFATLIKVNGEKPVTIHTYM